MCRQSRQALSATQLAALQRCIKSYHRKLWNFHLENSDVEQTLILHILEVTPTVDLTYSVPEQVFFLAQRAYGKLLDELGKRRVTLVGEQVVEVESAHYDSPESAYKVKQAVEKMYSIEPEVLSGLLQDRDGQEIAESMGITSSAISVRRNKLKTYLEKHL